MMNSEHELMSIYEAYRTGIDTVLIPNILIHYDMDPLYCVLRIMVILYLLYTFILILYTLYPSTLSFSMNSS